MVLLLVVGAVAVGGGPSDVVAHELVRTAADEPGRDGFVTSERIADRTIRAVDVAEGALTTFEIGDGQVTGADVADHAVTRSELASVGPDGTGGAVTTEKIDRGAITTSKITPQAVTTATLDGSDELEDTLTGRTRAVTAAVVADGAVIGRTIADGAVAERTLADDAVVGRTIADGAITGTELDSGFLDSLATDDEVTVAVGAEAALRSSADSAEASARKAFDDSLLDDDSRSRAVNDGDGLVSWWNLEDVPGDLADGVDDITVDASLLTTGSLNVDRLAVHAITGSKLALASDKGGARAIENDNIEPGTIQGDRLAAATVDAGAVTTGITAHQLEEDSVTAAQVADGTITADELRDGAVTTRQQTTNSLVLADPPVGSFPASGWVEWPLGGGASFRIDDDQAHEVLVTGQAMVACTGCVEGSSATVSYQLWRVVAGGPHEAISPVYQVTVGDPVPLAAPVSVSMVDQSAPAGVDIFYRIRFVQTGGGGTSFDVTNAVTNAVDLGQA